MYFGIKSCMKCKDQLRIEMARKFLRLRYAPFNKRLFIYAGIVRAMHYNMIVKYLTI